MAKNLIFNLDLYKLPLSEILQNHRKFYGIRRDHGEPMSRWLKRIQRCVSRCEFSPITAEFLTIDQFLCGLSSGELKSIQSINKSWTLKELLEYVMHGNSDSGHIETNTIPIDVMKPEPIEDDPLSVLSDETDLLVKAEEEFHPAENASSGGNVSYEVHEYVPQDEMELSVDSATSTKRSKLKAKSVQKKQKKIHRNLDARKPMAYTSAAGIFSKFVSTFTADELETLRRVGPNKSADCTFVLQVVRFLYKDDLKKLCEISVTGRSKGVQKEKMSSTNYDLIRKLLRERLKSLSLYAEEFTHREKQINKLIKNAISNLSCVSKLSMVDGTMN